MNRAHYFEYIERKLSELAVRIENRGQLNILDLHSFSEDFYLHFLNIIFDWNLENINSIQQNAAAIDLIDKKAKIVAQVSSTSTKSKIESALAKDIAIYSAFTFKFISISKDASALKGLKYKNPYGLQFNPATDIYDIASLLKTLKPLPVEKLFEIYEFIKRELGADVEPQKIESGLASIINTLARDDLGSNNYAPEVDAFEVERKIEFNSLSSARGIVEDYAVHYGRLDRIYSEYNRSGVNKSDAVLASLRNAYLQNKNSLNNDAIFFKIVNFVILRVQQSSNGKSMPFEELELCANIVVVDAFIRCKIFENPTRKTVASS